MKVHSGLACVLVLVACDLTDPRFLGAPVTHVEIGGSHFEVRQRGDTALALRTNAEPPQRYAAAMTRAVLAIEQATGCLVLRADGDAQAARARLDCGPDGGLPRQPRDFDCDAVEIYDGFFELRCRPGI